MRLPGGPELRNPSSGELSRALGIGLELGTREEVDLRRDRRRPGRASARRSTAPRRGSRRSSSRARARRPGRNVTADRELPRLSGGHQRQELTGRAITQARKFGARTATPYRALALEPGVDRHIVHLEEGHEVAARAVVLATGADYRRLPVARLDEFEGISVFYAAGPPEARRCGATRVGVVGGGNSAAQAAIWLARGGALVTLLHRRADLRETMSDYLVHDLERYGVAVRDRSEIAELHGEDGQLEAVTLKSGERVPFAFLFFFLGAAPCTDWLGDVVARDDKGFIVTGVAGRCRGLLETSVPGIFAAGDVRSGSVKRCATAVGEGAMVVRFVHEHLSRVPA